MKEIKTYTEEEVAQILYEAIGDEYACNINCNDEWLPYVCEYGDSAECPSGKDCWLQYIKHRHQKDEVYNEMYEKLTIEQARNVVDSFIRQFSRRDDMPTAVQGLEIAKEALEKQITKKVTKFVREPNDEVLGAGYCPICNCFVTEHASYCGQCGQKLNWGYEDD